MFPGFIEKNVKKKERTMKGPVLYLEEMIPAKKPVHDVVTFD